MKIGPIGFPETSVSYYRPMPRNIPEQRMNASVNFYILNDTEYTAIIPQTASTEQSLLCARSVLSVRCEMSFNVLFHMNISFKEFLVLC